MSEIEAHLGGALKPEFTGTKNLRTYLGIVRRWKLLVAVLALVDSDPWPVASSVNHRRLLGHRADGQRITGPTKEWRPRFG
jgi:hypothetical protein